MTPKETIVTKAGLKKFKDELEYLKKERRLEVAERIQNAKEQGDLSENAEYAAAKEEQSFVEGRIMELEGILKSVKVVEESKGGQVSIGSTVRLVDPKGEEIEYTLVGSNEADPTGGQISIESPIGSGLMGHQAGEELDIEVPNGTVKYKIIEIK